LGCTESPRYSTYIDFEKDYRNLKKTKRLNLCGSIVAKLENTDLDDFPKLTNTWIEEIHSYCSTKSNWDVKEHKDPMNDNLTISIVNKDSSPEADLMIDCGGLALADTIVVMHVQTNNLHFWNPDAAWTIKTKAEVRFDSNQSYDIKVSSFHNSKDYHVTNNTNFFGDLITSKKLSIRASDGNNSNTKTFNLSGLRNELLNQKSCRSQINKSCKYFAENENKSPEYCKEFK
jgi:hypothetical protein